MRRSGLAPFAALAAALLVAVVAGTAAGSVSIPFWTTAQVIAAHLFHQAPPTDAATAAIVYQIRLPRALVAALVGAGLGVSGAAMQGLYRNPLADPGLLGISSGAALGAVTILYGGFAGGDPWRVAGGAFLGALVTAAVVFRLGTRAQRTPVGLLLLAGLAVSNFLSAVISLLLTISHPAMLQLLIGWLMGSLDGRGWPQAAAVSLPILLASSALCAFGRTLNALATGEEDALALGFDIERHKRYVLALVAVATGVAVSVSGVVGFVGLVVPHVLRLIMGPDYRALLPASALGGAILVVAADLLARTLIRPIELNLGVVTAFIGVPFFIYLLRARHHGGLSL